MGGILVDWDFFVLVVVLLLVQVVLFFVGVCVFGLDFGVGVFVFFIFDLFGSSSGWGVGGDLLDVFFGLGVFVLVGNFFGQLLFGEVVV